LHPEIQGKLLLKIKAQHYAAWANQPLPVLDGQTPREAVKSEAGRRAVEELLRGLEDGEAGTRLEGQPVYDFSGLRKSLGL
jgi:hypothetical protein